GLPDARGTKPPLPHRPHPVCIPHVQGIAQQAEGDQDQGDDPFRQKLNRMIAERLRSQGDDPPQSHVEEIMENPEIGNLQHQQKNPFDPLAVVHLPEPHGQSRQKRRRVPRPPVSVCCCLERVHAMHTPFTRAISGGRHSRRPSPPPHCFCAWIFSRIILTASSKAFSGDCFPCATKVMALPMGSQTWPISGTLGIGVPRLACWAKPFTTGSSLMTGSSKRSLRGGISPVSRKRRSRDSLLVKCFIRSVAQVGFLL